MFGRIYTGGPQQGALSYWDPEAAVPTTLGFKDALQPGRMKSSSLTMVSFKLRKNMIPGLCATVRAMQVLENIL